jgi:hypothetical protein
MSTSERVALLAEFEDDAPEEIRPNAALASARMSELLDAVDTSGREALTEAMVEAQRDTRLVRVSNAVEQYIGSHCPPVRGCDPSVELTVTPEVITAGETVTVMLSAHANHGIDFAWWFAEDPSGQPDLLRQDLRPNGATTASDSWSVPLEHVGTYTFSANVRDVTYGDYDLTDPQDARRPRQASEGCGKPDVTIVVR